jgi:hypothetical protein
MPVRLTLSAGSNAEAARPDGDLHRLVVQLDDGGLLPRIGGLSAPTRTMPSGSAKKRATANSTIASTSTSRDGRT